MLLFLKNRWLLITVIFFAVVYALISLPNHYYFRTSALDLGLYTNALYDYIRFQWNDSTVFMEVPQNLLADHFDLYLIIFSPLSLLFGTYTLLIVQIIAVIAGGYGIFRYFSLVSENKWLPLLAMLHFFLFFGIFSAIAFDYHSSVVAAMILPWFFYFFRKENYKVSGILLLAMLISKENTGLWLFFVCLGLLFEYFRNRKAVGYLVIYSAFSALWFLVVVFFIMPALSNDGTFPHFRYSVLGNDPVSFITAFFSDPIGSIGILFTNHLPFPHGDFVKLEFHLFVFISGLYLLLFRPYYLLMLIPLYFQKMYHDNVWVWSVAYHYSAEFAPVLTLGAFSFISSVKKDDYIKLLSAVAIIGTLIATVRLMDNTVIFTNKSMIRFYKADHYQRDYDTHMVREAMTLIPPDAVVSAQSGFLPHLALRDRVYMFPIVRDAQYVIISEKENTYPLQPEEYTLTVKDLLTSPEWEFIVNKEGFWLLKRKAD
jgi:uncharacterized membrane protein